MTTRISAMMAMVRVFNVTPQTGATWLDLRNVSLLSPSYLTPQGVRRE
jgi:hypothetical protein